MLFEVVHTHTPENCPARGPEQIKAFSEWWQTVKKAPGVKILTGYVSPLDHTYYITVEADDSVALTKALGPLVGMGAGRLIPVMTLDQTLPIAQTGAFEAPK
jgi:hypothetical protein